MEATHEPDDLTLASDAALGDSAAFTELFHRHYPMIHALAYRLSFDATLAEDIAQDTFVKAARSLGEWRPVGSFKGWLCRIAVNASRDALRKKRRTTELTDEWARQAESAEETAPADFGHLTQALAGLSDEYRQVVALVFYEGLSHREAASVLGCAETTVSWRLFRARQKLKKMLTSNRNHSRE
jgi:RNA polymerase sigma-70 factor (ECF subfamily)